MAKSYSIKGITIKVFLVILLLLFNTNLIAQNIIDVDINDNGLIEINDLVTLNAMRYQPDGSGLRLNEGTRKISTGCLNNICRGYELTRDLNFNDDDSYSSTTNKVLWTQDVGWQPIGDADNPFVAIFEGNGHTISDLTIKRNDVDDVGLFGRTGSGADITNLGLLNLNITISSSANVGGLVGRNDTGTIANSHATGFITALAAEAVGGLVGLNTNSTITNSYVMGSARGNSRVGGLVGRNDNGTITNSYATSSVSGGTLIGGLVGRNDSGTITNSYVTGSVSGRTLLGGLIGTNLGSVSFTYWLKEMGSTLDDIGIGSSLLYDAEQTAEMLRSPIRPGGNLTDIYHGWDEASWDFGTSDQFPVLKNADDNTLLPSQGIGLRRLDILAGGAELNLIPIFNDSVRYYAVDLPANTETVNLRLTAYNMGTAIQAVKRGEDTDYFSGKANGEQNDPISVVGDTVLVITVAETGMDTISYGIDFQQAEISDITVSENDITDTDDIVNEGSTITLDAIIDNVYDDGGNFSYEWTQTEGQSLMLSTTATTSLSFTIPVDYIKSNTATSSDIVIQLTLMDNRFSSVSSLSKRITILKINNDQPELDNRLTVNGFTLRFDGSDITDSDGGVSNLSYQWQMRGINSQWMDIASATTASYTVSSTDLNDTLYRVRVTYSDAQGYENIRYATAVDFRSDVDDDNNGLIEVYYLEHLDAIRYALDGTRYATTASAGINRGCKAGGCNGYELARSLDFNDDASYASTSNKVLWTSTGSAGWQPIGDEDDPFVAIFEGGGYTLANLTINQNGVDDVGLFANTGSGSKIADLGLLNLSITLASATNVGGLVGRNDNGTIMNSYVTGSVSARSNRSVGGLVGFSNNSTITASYAMASVGGDSRIGGLVGLNNNGIIMVSYATGSVIGDSLVGGLVGRNSGGTITNNYATVSVRGKDEVGSLVGLNRSGTITNNYTTGSVRGRSNTGGLAGRNSRGGSISNSYWLIEKSPTLNDISGGSLSYGAGRTVEMLKSATEPGANSTDAYHGWDERSWDFGTADQFPVLKDASNNVLLPNQGVGLRSLEISAGDLELALIPVFADSGRHYVVDLPSSMETVDLKLTAYNMAAAIKAVKQGEDTDYFSGKANGEQSNPIAIQEDTTLVITVTEAETDIVSYQVDFQRAEISDITVSERLADGTTDNDDMVSEGSTVTLDAVITDGSGNFAYEWTQTEGSPLMLSSTATASPSFTIPDNYIKSDTSTNTDIVIQLRLNDRRFDSISLFSKRITIRKINNDEPELDQRLAVNGLTLRFDESDITDSDGAVSLSYQWQMRGINSQWADIASATTAGYTVSATDPGDKLYRIRITYTDAQGYGGIEYATAFDFRVDVDDDDDGLIEVYYLEHLDAIRYDADGTHYATTTETTGINRGCKAGVCNGYELARSLDFNDDASYISTSNKVLWTAADGGSGWQSIGDDDDSFIAIFDGNNHTLSNLTINQDDLVYAGLFGRIGNGSNIANLGLLDVDIITTIILDTAGSLVAWNEGSITNSYATGSVTALAAEYTGGLVGFNSSGIITNSYAKCSVRGQNAVGGLVGANTAQVAKSYATGSVVGILHVGGLVGLNENSTGMIMASYATGATTGNSDVGGLVGQHANGAITTSYATGSSSGTFFIGGLVGRRIAGTIATSYWLQEKDAVLNDIGDNLSLAYVAGRTAEMLKSPTAPATNPSDVYYRWEEANWDFGSSDQFPILNADSDTLLPGQGVGLRDLEVLTVGSGLTQVFGESTTHYVIAFLATINSIDLKLRAYNTSATIKVVKQGMEDTDYFVGKGSSGQSDPIPIDEDTVLIITVTDGVTEADTSATVYTLNFDEVELSDILTISDITISEDGATDADNIVSEGVSEGSAIVLDAIIENLYNDDGDYSYQWIQTAGKPLLPNTTTASPSFTIPADFIASDTIPSTDIVIRLELRDNDLSSLSVDLSKTITVNKIDNGVPVIATTLTQSDFDLAVQAMISEADIDGDGNLSYQWQSRDPNSQWADIPSATATRYTVPMNAASDRLYRLRLTYIDAQGYSNTEYVVATGFRTDVDNDNDGLIEVYYLEHLDAIRYDLDGTHYATMFGSVGINRGCRTGGCNGYELARSLDFNDDASYASTSNKVLWTGAGGGVGWQPIGSEDNPFISIFAGNDQTLSNLTINQNDVDDVGLFGRTGSGAEITNLGLLNANITISTSTVVGGLVGRNDRGLITNSYVIGSISGTSADEIGGLVGRNEAGIISNSYAMGSLSGTSTVGGLVGRNEISQGEPPIISNSYATVSVNGTSIVGGLVATNRGNITNSYTTGSTTGTSIVGGLIGSNSGSVSQSYWLIERSPMLNDLGDDASLSYVAGRTARMLKFPIRPGANSTDVYHGWGERSWDFGTADQFPILKDASNNVLLPNQGVGLRSLEVLAGDAAFPLIPTFTDSIQNYVADLPSSIETVNLKLTAYNMAAAIKVVKQGEDTDYFSAKASSEQSNPIAIDTDTTLIITVTEADDEADTVSYQVGFQESKISDITVSERSANGTTDTDNIVSEGSTVTLDAIITDSSENLAYQWTQTQGEIVLPSTTTTSPSFRVPDDYIKSGTSTNTDIVIQLRLSDEQSSSLSLFSKRITIHKINNDEPELDVGLTVNGLTLSIDESNITDSDGGVPNFQYQWQMRDINSQWADIPSATAADYTVSSTDPGDRLYRVRITYTDGQGYRDIEYATAISFRSDVDDNDNGLIEVYYLEHLDAIRYDLDGTHYATTTETTGINRGCKVGGCNGYELARSLDFNDDASYISTSNKVLWTVADGGSGWQSIGDDDNSFIAIFDGNNHTLSNLTINQGDFTYFGLFGRTRSGSNIANLGLLDVDIITGISLITVGSLVAWNEGSITNSYATGSITALSAEYTGGLVGFNSTGIITNSYAKCSVRGWRSVGGLVGANTAKVAKSYATGSVAGTSRVGGLVGWNENSTAMIMTSYATGATTGNFDVGGLIGRHANGALATSYATGSSTGTFFVGGLVGRYIVGTIATSYWLKEESSALNDIGGDLSLAYVAGRTAEMLKSPIAPGTNPSDVYHRWDKANWDFGTSDQFPALNADSDTLLPGQGIGLRDLEVLTVGSGLTQAFGASTTHYVIGFLAATSSIDLRLRAYNTSATIKVVKQGAEDTDYFSGKGSSGQSDPIPIDEDTVLVIMVTEGVTETDTSAIVYTLNFAEVELSEILRISDIVVSENGMTDTDDIVSEGVSEGSTVVLEAVIASLYNDDRDYSYQWTQTAGKPLLSNTTNASPSFTIPVDFVASDTVTSIDIVIQLELRDNDLDSLVVATSKTITVNKIDNGVPVIATTLTQSNFDLSVEARIIDADIDGDGGRDLDYQWQERDFNTNNWVAIPSATATNYTVPMDAPGGRLYRLQLTHTDAQGYKFFEYLMADEIRQDVDTDDDGLIEIYYLEHLDAIRYDLDGTHYATMPGSVGINRGCREGVCDGYELAGSLDFDDDASYISTSNKVLWTSGDGWQPIGDLDEPFDARFASTDTLVISNLFIDRPDEDYVGLFGVSNGQISGLNLQDVDIGGRFIVGGIAGVSLESSMISDNSVNGTVSGSDAWVGGLVGVHDGSIINSHARGEVIGDTSVGGLAGYASGRITNSDAHSNIKSQAYGGGLVGYHQGRQEISGISDSYASGSVEGALYVGGLVGYNDGGVIANVYALGDVVGGTNVGGLVGYNDGGMITASAGAGNIAGANNVGDLAGSVNGGSITGEATIPDLQDAVVGRLLALGELTLSIGTLEPPFDPSVDEYELFDFSGLQTLVTATANKANATVAIGLGSQTMSINSQSSLMVQLADLMNDDIVVTLTASGLTTSGQTTKTYTITLPAQPDLTGNPLAPCSTTDIDEDGDGLIEICDIEGLYAMRYRLDGSAYKANSTAADRSVGCPSGGCIGYELMRDLDFGIDASYRTTANKAILGEGRGWHPIGTFARPFDAVFNANDHAIANLKVDRVHRDYVGLFAHVGATAKLENIRLADAYVRGRSVVGALVGSNDGGTIVGSHTSNVATTTLVVGSGVRVGGLVGDHQGIIEHGSYASGVVQGNRSVGGLVGYFRGLNSEENELDYGIINSYAESAVHGRAFSGGLVGSNINRIVNGYAIGDVASTFHAGGLVGINGGTITNTYARGDVSGGEIVGGLVGENEGSIADSYAIGMVLGQRLVGELVGNNSGIIRRSYGVGSMSLVGSDSDGTTINSIVVVNLAELEASIDRNSWDANAWRFEDGKYPALRYITSTGCENDSSCGQLLGGQYPQLVSLTIEDTPGDSEVSLLRINPLNYRLIVGSTNTMIMLTPTARDNTTLLSYSTDGTDFAEITSGSPFTISGTIETIIIRLSVPADDPNFAYLQSADYIVLTEQATQGIKIRIKVFLEGPLQ